MFSRNENLVSGIDFRRPEKSGLRNPASRIRFSMIRNPSTEIWFSESRFQEQDLREGRTVSAVWLEQWIRACMPLVGLGLLVFEAVVPPSPRPQMIVAAMALAGVGEAYVSRIRTRRRNPDDDLGTNGKSGRVGRSGGVVDDAGHDGDDPGLHRWRVRARYLVVVI